MRDLYSPSLLPPKLREAILRFDTAARTHAFRGAAHPGDVPEINAEYRESRDELDKAILKAIQRGRIVPHAPEGS